ncbi:MAG: response regulator [Chloroflexota bacterium]
MRILYIEDNIMNFRLVQKMLKRNHEVTGAYSGEDGLRAVHEENPDLILLDINLPGMNGFQVLEQLRCQACFDHIPIIALTANAMYGDREHILNADFDGYLAKPVTRVELETALRRCVPISA